MTTTIVFIHGVTVRKDRFSRLLTSMRFGVCLSNPDVDVAGRYRGDLASLEDYRGLAIPHDGSRGLGDASEAPWWEDPLAGLRTLRDGDGFGAAARTRAAAGARGAAQPGPRLGASHGAAAAG